MELPEKIMDRSQREVPLVPLVKEMLVARLIPQVGVVVPAVEVRDLLGRTATRTREVLEVLA